MPEKHEIFAKSYDEALAALKHQDDKLGRQLTALAFLTGAAVALFNAWGSAEKAVSLPGSGVSVTAFCFAVFAVAAGGALITALSAIGPARGFARLSGGDVAPPHSLLYFRSIARHRNGWWAGLLGDQTTSEALTQTLTENYHTEAADLSNRVLYKIVLSRLASAFLQVAIAALILLAVFVSDAFAIETRWGIATAFLLALAALPLVEGGAMLTFEFPERPRDRRPYVFHTVNLALIGILLVLALWLDSYWWALPYALFGGVLAPRLALVDSSLTRILQLVTLAGVGMLVGALTWPS